jgi:hypothetical protein
MKTRDGLLYAIAIVATMSWMPRGAEAAANGDGICSPAEAAGFECATLGTNVIEFLGSFPSQACPTNASKRCTSYYYRYTGAATCQLNAAIPTRHTKILTTATEINCSQYLTGGTGDPTTGFGKNQRTLGICRIAYNLGANASVVPPALTGIANVVINVDPSTFDKENPLDWQLKQGNKVYAGSILGPYTSQPTILESAVTLTTPTGESVSYTNAGGNITVTGGTGADVRAVPLSGTKLCIVNPGGDPSVPYTSPAFSTNWTCETITYATEQCDIKTQGTDPCRFIGGTCIKY